MSDESHRSERLQLRVPADASVELRRRAAEAGVDLSTYVLDRALPDWPRVDGRTLRRLDRLGISPLDWASARELARRLAPGDRLGSAELGTLGPALAEVLRDQGLDLREDTDGHEIVRASE